MGEDTGVTTTLDAGELPDELLVRDEQSEPKEDFRELEERGGDGEEATGDSGEAGETPRCATLVPAGVRFGRGAIFLRLVGFPIGGAGGGDSKVE
jgi:hypothetical protein